MSNITLHNKYQYRITDRLGTYLAQTFGEGKVSINYGLQDDIKIDYTKTLDGKLTFTGVDHERFMKLEKSQYRCDLISIVVQRRCAGSSTFMDWFSGTISLNDGTFNESKCEVDFKIAIKDLYSPWETIKGNEYNIFSFASIRRTVRLSPGNITIESVNYSANPTNMMECRPVWGGTGTPADGKWKASHTHCDAFYPPSMPAYLQSSTTWVREAMTLACTIDPGPAWTLVLNNCGTNNTQKWVREATVVDCVYTQTGDNTQTGYSYDMLCKTLGQSAGGAATQLQNGLLVYDVLLSWLQIAYGVSVKLVSDFFQWNPDNISDLNPVTNAKSKTKYLFIFQKSDVKRPASGNPATQGILTPEKLVTALCNTYNLGWHIEDRAGVPTFKIEHVSKFPKKIGLNLMDPKFEKWLRGKLIYSYDNEKIPKQEVFTWMESDYNGDFKGLPINYTNGCVVTTQKDQVKTIAVDFINNDIAYILSNRDSESKLVSDNGFTFVACDFDGTNYIVITEAGILGPASANNSLAWAQLHRDYWKYNRPLRNGNMNGQDTTFLTVKPIKKGEPITIPFCCDDFTGDLINGTDPFSPFDNVIGPFGTGKVDKASINLKNDTITLDLLYAANEDLEQNKPPIAVNESYAIYNDGTDFYFSPSENDTDPEGSPFTRVGIISGPFHGTAIVLEDLRIKYTPNVGFTGDDFIYYKVYDNWDEGSNTALVSITVRPANAPPVAVNDSYQASKNTPLSVTAANGVFKNDTDDVGFTLDHYDATTTAGGTVSMASNGSFTYTPPSSSYTGTDTFTYRIIDELNQTSTATVTITVVDLTLPRAVDDVYSTMRNTTLSIPGYPGVIDGQNSVGANDYLPVGYTFRTNAITDFSGDTTQGGNYAIFNSGQIYYTPPSNFIGADTLTYSLVSPSDVVLSTATITVNVHQVVFARLSYVAQQYSYVYGSCGSGQQVIGQRTPYTLSVSFFTDSGLTTPLDVTAMNFKLRIKRNQSDSSNGGATTVTTTETYYNAVGTVTTIFSNTITDEFRNDCQGNSVFRTSSNFQLISTNNYATV